MHLGRFSPDVHGSCPGLRRVGHGGRFRTRFDPPEPLLHEFREGIVVHLARRSHNEVPACVAAPVERGQVFARDGRDRITRAQNRVAVGVSPPHPFAVKLEDEVVGGVLYGRNLLAHHLPFAVQIFLGQQGAAHQIRDHVHCNGEVGRQHASLIPGVLARGVRVQRSTQTLQREGDLLPGAALRAAEDHVLQEVTGTQELRRLQRTPLPSPGPHGHGPNTGNGFAQDVDAVPEPGCPIVQLRRNSGSRLPADAGLLGSSRSLFRIRRLL